MALNDGKFVYHRFAGTSSKAGAAVKANAWFKRPGGTSPLTRQREIAIFFASILLGALIFVVDTFTNIESAIAVFYVIVVILSASILTRIGVLVSSLICGGLSVASYFISHGAGDDLSTLLRLAGALLALGITTALLFRNDMVEADLLASHEKTRKSVVRYRSIFQQSRVALWEQDFSELKVFLDSLKAKGVRDLILHSHESPDFIGKCAELVETTAMNNAALEMLGGTTQDQMAGPISRFIPDDAPCFFELVRALFDGKRRFESKGRLRDLNGEETTILMAVEFPEAEEALDRVVVGLLDITQRETTQAALMAAQAELARASRVTTVGALSSSIAHELNQPLAALVMNAEACLRWLRRDQPDVDSAIVAAERLMRDGMRASDIIKTTRALLARKPILAESIDLALVVHETRALMAYELERQNVEFELIADPQTPRVASAKTELQQALINLLTNSLQAMADGETRERMLTVSIGPSSESYVRLSVKDTGPGFGPDIDKLFVPFYTTKSQGMGMGLAISKATIEAQGGKLTASNQADGAVFEILLPVERTLALVGANGDYEYRPATANSS